MKITLLVPDGLQTAAFAAAELRDHLSRATSEIEIELAYGKADLVPGNVVSHGAGSVPKDGSDAVLFSGKSPSGIQVILACDTSLSASEKDDAYFIHIDSSGGQITGSNERSILLAVYALLRKVGFRFLLPDHTLLPENLSFSDLCVDIRQQAYLRHRGVCIEGADSLENVIDFISWLPKLGFNSFFLQFAEPYIFFERWYHHIYNPTIESEELTEEFLQSCYERLYRELKKRSLLLHAYGHGWTCEAIGLKSIGWVREAKEPSAETRQILALIDGKREFVDQIPMNTNLCYSDRRARKLFCDTVASYVRQHPEADYLHIWLADEPNHICECDSCRATTPTDQYVSMLNEIDAVLTAERSECRIVFLLYQELLYPPVKERFKNPDRFVLMFAPISRTFRRSYPKTISPIPLPEYQRNRMKLPESIEENLSYLYGWQQCFSGESFVYDYPLGRAHYGDFGYVSISRVIAGDIAHIRSLGLDGYMSCQELRAFFPNGLPNYVMGYLLMEREETFEGLLNEYFLAAYGSSFSQAKSYLTALSDLSDCDYINSHGDRRSEAEAGRFEKLCEYAASHEEEIGEIASRVKKSVAPVIDSRSVGPQGKDILSSMQSAAETGLSGGTASDILSSMRSVSETAYDSQETAAFFWDILVRHNRYVQLLCRALVSLSSGDAEEADRRYAQFLDYIRGSEREIQPYLDVYRVTEVTSKYTGFTIRDRVEKPAD